MSKSSNVKRIYENAITNLRTGNLNENKRTFINLNGNANEYNEERLMYYIGGILGSVDFQNMQNEIRYNMPAISHWELLGVQNIVDILNFNLLNKPMNDPENEIRLISYYHYLGEGSKMKVQVAFGLLLSSSDDNVRYWRASANNGYLFDSAKMISSSNALKRLWREITSRDVFELTEQSLPRDRDSATRMLGVCNLTMFVYKMTDNEEKYGCAGKIVLPAPLRKNRNIIHFLRQKHKNVKSQARFNDNLCMLRCIAAAKYLSSRCAKAPKSLSQRDYELIEKMTGKLYKQWRMHKGISKDEFMGIGDDELRELASLFSVNIYLHSLNEQSSKL